MAFLLGMPYGLVQHGPDHVGVRDHDRSSVLGNTMLQHSPDGVPFFFMRILENRLSGCQIVQRRM